MRRAHALLASMLATIVLAVPGPNACAQSNDDVVLPMPAEPTSPNLIAEEPTSPSLVAEEPPLPHSTSTPAARDPSSGTALLWPRARLLGSDVIRGPSLVAVLDEGLVVAGAITLAAGLVAGLVIAGADAAAGNCRAVGYLRRTSCDSWALAFLPVGGAVAAGVATFDGVRETNTAGVLGGSFAAVGQLIGLFIIMGAVHGRAEQLRTAEHVRIAPDVSSTSLALVVGVDL